MHIDLMFTNGLVITMDRHLPVAEALAVAGDRIIAVGNQSSVGRLASPSTRIVDLHGRVLLPGFNDAHCHPSMYGRSLLQIDCRPQVVHCLDDIVEAVKAEAARREAGQWILGRGYNDMQLPPNYAITRYDLDPVSPKHPVCLTRACGHVLVANSYALALAGITRETPDPAGGQVQRDANGEPTGVLCETALDLIYGIIPPPTAEEVETSILRATQEYVAAGITSVQDALVTEQELGAYMRLHSRQALPLRVFMMFKPELLGFLVACGLQTGIGDNRLRLGPLKILLDGGIGARTAAQSQPYHNEPNNCGILWMEQKELNDLVERAYRAGFQVATHAIGDRAIRSALDAYERVLRQWPRSDHRLRIEHFTLPLGDLVERVAQLGVVITSQPVFLYEAGWNYVTNLGETRAREVFPFRRILEAGVSLAFSSDSPVSSFVPLAGIQAAVSRRTQMGDVIGSGQELSVAEALCQYTLGSAYASGEEGIKGSLTAGKLADLVVLNRDPLQTPADELATIEVDMTVVGGQIVYQRN